MSHNIPFEIQVEIIKNLPLKSLLQFRSVSRSWKSLIDSSNFINHYTGQQHLLVSYDNKYISIIDDHAFPKHILSPHIPLLVTMLIDSSIIGTSHGLLCLYGSYRGRYVAVIWNVSARKALPVVVHNVTYRVPGTVLGFGVCRETNDPQIVKITYVDSYSVMDSATFAPRKFEVFTLSTRGWRSLDRNLPRESVQIYRFQVGVDVDGFLYWLATDTINVDDGFVCVNNLIISFDMTSEEFREVELPFTLAHYRPIYELSISKVTKSLVVVQHGVEANNHVISVWMMEDGVAKSFTKMFTICIPHATFLRVREFRKSGEPVMEILEDQCDPLKDDLSLIVYEPYSKHISYLGITGISSFSLFSYMESLLLFDEPDVTTYDDI